MKNATLFLIGLLWTLSSFSQSYKTTWGEEIKLKKGTADLDVVAADNTGLFFTEKRAKVQNHIIFATVGTSVKLYKFDKNFLEAFEKEYRKELRGLDFHSFQTLGQDLYMFASDYEKKGKWFKIYAAKVDKTSGDLVTAFNEIGAYQLENKRDDYEMRVSAIRNGTEFMVVSNISSEEKVSIGISVLDKSLRKEENTVINFNYEPGEYQVEDVKYSKDDKIVLLGKHFEKTQVGKKKRKRFVFKDYVMDIYNNSGVKEKSVDLSNGSKFTIGGKLIEKQNGGLLLAGFYSNDSKKDNLDGFFVNSIDLNTGALTVNSFKEVNAGMLGKAFTDDSDGDDDEDVAKKSSKNDDKKKGSNDEEDEEEELPNEFTIRSVDVNPSDNSIVITSEISKLRVTTSSYPEYNSVTKTTRWVYKTNYDYSNKDVLIINADANGQIKWLNVLPKSQHEYIQTQSDYYGAYTLGNYFAESGGYPYYSSFATTIQNNNLIIVMNDHTSNNVNAGYGDKVRTVSNFKKRSNLYGISVDLATGKMTRKMITPNSSENILAPRHALVVKNEFYIPSYRPRSMAKTELKFMKLTVR